MTAVQESPTTPHLTLQHARAELDQGVLRSAFGSFPSGVVGVCAMTDDGPVGMAASSFVPVSIQPPIVAFCVQWTSSTWPVLEKAGTLGISVLGASHDLAARQLASKTGSRFAGLGLHTTASGAVLLDGAGAWLECTVRDVVPAGDHGIVLLGVEALTTTPGVEPLVFHASAFRQLQQLVAS
ncbi:flavin reductase family protein [Nocardioides sp. C4-1]|uniref:flavin reductase family protein n=1 Tax=Nocardioides sp. C4-1 TaxID=3151851 RepID=UPI003263ED9C